MSRPAEFGNTIQRIATGPAGSLQQHVIILRFLFIAFRP